MCLIVIFSCQRGSFFLYWLGLNLFSNFSQVLEVIDGLIGVIISYFIYLLDFWLLYLNFFSFNLFRLYLIRRNLLRLYFVLKSRVSVWCSHRFLWSPYWLLTVHWLVFPAFIGLIFALWSMRMLSFLRRLMISILTLPMAVNTLPLRYSLFFVGSLIILHACLSMIL